MGGQLSKGGVAVEGKVVADPAAAKTNGQVSNLWLMFAPFTWSPTPTYRVRCSSLAEMGQVIDTKWFISTCVQTHQKHLFVGKCGYLCPTIRLESAKPPMSQQWHVFTSIEIDYF